MLLFLEILQLRWHINNNIGLKYFGNLARWFCPDTLINRSRRLDRCPVFPLARVYCSDGNHWSYNLTVMTPARSVTSWRLLTSPANGSFGEQLLWGEDKKDGATLRRQTRFLLKVTCLFGWLYFTMTSVYGVPRFDVHCVGKINFILTQVRQKFQKKSCFFACEIIWVG